MAQAITESTRFALQQRVREVLGEQEGDTLMAHLPPVGWADVATKKDLERLANKEDLLQLKDELGGRISALDGRISSLDGRCNSLEVRIERGFRRQTVWIAASLGVMFTLTTSLWVGLVVWLGQRLPSP